MTRPATHDAWTRFAPPRAPVALRDRVLAASARVTTACPVATRSDRIWFSRGWRLAWVATLAALVALEAVAVRRHAARRPVVSSAQTETHEAEGAALALGLAPGGWLGERVVSGRTVPRITMEELR